ncbi:hypothetical protein [Lacinutrix sp. MEBiC02404]
MSQLARWECMHNAEGEQTALKKYKFMSYKVYIVLFLLPLIGCKNESRQVEEKNTTLDIVESTKKAIPVYSISFLAKEAKESTENISSVTKNLLLKYKAYPFDKHPNEFEEFMDIYKSKDFINTLARDFDNKNFLDIETKYYSFITPKDNLVANYITIEQWQYPSVKKAKSVFESLKNYKEKEIYFKTINWIWVY